MNKKIIQLTPPIISTDHISEKISCIRAHRERIFRVETEQWNNKLVSHNYGHGGAGWTFLFGCVQESIRQFEKQLQENSFYKNKPICVVGAGCYGLLTAIMLTRKGHQVHIIAKEIENITSYKAAGFFFPRSRKCSTPQERALFQSYGMNSYKEYLAIASGSHPFLAAGSKILPAYYSLDIDPGYSSFIDQELVSKPEQITIDFGTGKQYDVMRYETIFINTLAMMNELHRNIAELRIPIARSEVSSFDEINDEIIFNCSGLGVRQLVNDPRIVPVQGHLILLKNQPPSEQLQYLINVKVLSTNLKGMPRDELIYFAPKRSGILGITFLRGQQDETANTYEFDRLLERSINFFGKNR